MKGERLLGKHSSHPSLPPASTHHNFHFHEIQIKIERQTFLSETTGRQGPVSRCYYLYSRQTGGAGVAGGKQTEEEAEREPGTADLPANTFLFQFFRSVASRLHQRATGSATPLPSIIRKPSTRRGAPTDARRGTRRSVTSGPPRSSARQPYPEPGAPPGTARSTAAAGPRTHPASSRRPDG